MNDPPTMAAEPRTPALEAINTDYLERRTFACGEYEDVGKEAGPLSDDDVYNEWSIDRFECEVATFRISPGEVQVFQDGVAAMTREYDVLWAAYNDVRRQFYNLYDVLKQVREFSEKEP